MNQKCDECGLTFKDGASFANHKNTIKGWRDTDGRLHGRKTADETYCDRIRERKS